MLGSSPSQRASSLVFAEMQQSEQNSHYFSSLVNIVSHSRSLDLKAKRDRVFTKLLRSHGVAASSFQMSL